MTRDQSPGRVSTYVDDEHDHVLVVIETPSGRRTKYARDPKLRRSGCPGCCRESPFWPTVAAGTVLVVVHRAIAMACARSKRFERMIKGPNQLLYRSGEIDWAGMRRAGISRADLDEAARGKANVPTHSDVAEIYIESSGELTVVERAAQSERDVGAR
jgi:hypothetical protein